MKKNIIGNFKIISLQSDTYYIGCRLEKSIPEGIIVYYPLVSFIYETFEKNSFDRLLFFFFLKKFIYINILFFAGLFGLLVLFNKINRLEAIFKTEHKTNETKYLKYKINRKQAASPSKIRPQTNVKNRSKCGQKKFLNSKMVFRKFFLYSHPPPSTQKKLPTIALHPKYDARYKYKLRKDTKMTEEIKELLKKLSAATQKSIELAADMSNLIHCALRKMPEKEKRGMVMMHILDHAMDKQFEALTDIDCLLWDIQRPLMKEEENV